MSAPMDVIPLGRRATPADPLRIAVLVSGRGSNMEALANAAARGEAPIRIVLVASDRPEAPALRKAEAMGLLTEAFDFRSFAAREAYHDALAARIEAAGAECIALAGYMRILPPSFVGRFRHRIVNIHPSLLPAFPGLRPHEQALAHGVKLSGCTVHLVDEGVDSGPILLQQAVPVHDDDTAEALAARILMEEHRLYPRALSLLASGRLALFGRRVIERDWSINREEV